MEFKKRVSKFLIFNNFYSFQKYNNVSVVYWNKVFIYLAIRQTHQKIKGNIFLNLTLLDYLYVEPRGSSRKRDDDVGSRIKKEPSHLPHLAFNLIN